MHIIKPAQVNSEVWNCIFTRHGHSFWIEQPLDCRDFERLMQFAVFVAEETTWNLKIRNTSDIYTRCYGVDCTHLAILMIDTDNLIYIGSTTKLTKEELKELQIIL